MENTVKRITKAMRYEDIIALLEGGEVKHGTTINAAIEFIKNEMTLLAKKNSSKSDKPTATQIENERYRELIMEFLCANPDGKFTCTEIAQNIPEFAGFNNQRIAAFMRRLCDDDRVDKTKEKGKSLFSVR